MSFEVLNSLVLSRIDRIYNTGKREIGNSLEKAPIMEKGCSPLPVGVKQKPACNHFGSVFQHRGPELVCSIKAILESSSVGPSPMWGEKK